MVRLSASQLRRSYTALLGDGLVLPELPLDEAGAGFSSVAAAVTTVARREAEVYEAAAYAVLDQVWAEADRRDALVGCAPVDLEAPCVDVFLEDSASHVPGGAPRRGAVAPAGARAIGRGTPGSPGAGRQGLHEPTCRLRVTGDLLPRGLAPHRANRAFVRPIRVNSSERQHTRIGGWWTSPKGIRRPGTPPLARSGELARCTSGGV